MKVSKNSPDELDLPSFSNALLQLLCCSEHELEEIVSLGVS